MEPITSRRASSGSRSAARSACQAFGMNAYVAGTRATTSSRSTREETLGHEEVYVVLAGRATFDLDGESARRARRDDRVPARPGGATPRARRGARNDRARGRRQAGRGVHAVCLGVVLRGRAVPRPARPEGGARAHGGGEASVPRAPGRALLDRAAGRPSTAARTTRGRHSSARSSWTRGRASGRSTTRTSPRSATGSEEAPLRSSRLSETVRGRDVPRPEAGCRPRGQSRVTVALRGSGLGGTRAPHVPTRRASRGTRRTRRRGSGAP